MYEMNCLEQACLMNRLGPDNIFDLKHASIHFVLDFTNSTHEETAKKLVQYAQQETELPNFWNFKLMGKKKQVQENSNMWALLTTENSAPLLEFDFIGGDGFELLGKTPEDMKNMSHGERLDVRSRQGKKQELLRLQQTFSYWVESGEDLDTYGPPEWATRDVLYKPLPDKAPWVAGWDRFIRKLIRMEEANGVEDENPLCDLFDEFAKMEGRMTLDELQDLLTTTLGFSKQDQGQIQRIFHEKATNTADRTKKVLSGAALRAKDAHKTNQPTVTHKAFLQIFMQELPKLIRSKAKTPVDGTAET
ncbi:hypothetical protein BSKO_04439 [Bryopsis sp. KO-2023]|nr:hypothetical protein BSKO_04439 [Bryopsis sp. KO-2023]